MNGFNVKEIRNSKEADGVSHIIVVQLVLAKASRFALMQGKSSE
jgi:hypothetical protein